MLVWESFDTRTSLLWTDLPNGLADQPPKGASYDEAPSNPAHAIVVRCSLQARWWSHKAGGLLRPSTQ